MPSQVTPYLEDNLRSILCHLAKENGHRVHEMVVSCAVEQIFNETAMHAKVMASNHLAKVNRASRGPRVRAKGKSKGSKGRSKGKSKGSKRCHRLVPG